MTDSQRLTLSVSEARSALNGLIEARNKLPDNQEPDAEAIRRMDEATRRVSSLEVEHRAVIVVEAGEEEHRNQESPDGEEVERRRLLARSSIVPFVAEAVDGRHVDGAEAECRAAVLGDDGGNLMPIDLLLPSDEVERRSQAQSQTEYRADAVTPVAAAALADGSQSSMLERIFTRSVAARLGVSMPSVPAGAAVFPIMTSGTTASMANDGTQVDAGAGTFTGHTLEPVRMSAGYLFNARQTLQLKNFEAILRRDLAAVLSDAMDNQIVNGDGTAPNVSGFLNELPAVTRPSAADTFASYLEKFTGAVDGLNAFTLGDLRSVMGAASYSHMYSVYRSNNSDLPAYEAVAGRVGGLSVSSRIPAPTTTGGEANTQNNIMAMTSYPGRNAVAPVWRGLELIRDPYTLAGKGQVRLTTSMFWSFKILRETGWSLWAARTA